MLLSFYSLYFSLVFFLNFILDDVISFQDSKIYKKRRVGLIRLCSRSLEKANGSRYPKFDLDSALQCPHWWLAAAPPLVAPG